MHLVAILQIAIGQMVSLGGYPSDWLLVDRAEGNRLRLRRPFGEPETFSAGFWIDSDLVREVRWPDL
jgi:hypothetical protein